MKNKSILLITLVLIISTLLSGCYINEELEPNESAAKLRAGLFEGCLGPGGVYTDMGWWADLKHVTNDTLTFSVEDPEVATSDNQLVGIKITIQARRDTSCKGIQGRSVLYLP